eukprot:g16831.t1
MARVLYKDRCLVSRAPASFSSYMRARAPFAYFSTSPLLVPRTVPRGSPSQLPHRYPHPHPRTFVVKTAFSEMEHKNWERAVRYHEGFGPLTAQFVRRLLDTCQVGPGSRLLDVAAGSGLMAAEALRTYGAHVTALDFSQMMLKLARPRLKEASIERLGPDGKKQSWRDWVAQYRRRGKHIARMLRTNKSQDGKRPALSDLVTQYRQTGDLGQNEGFELVLGDAQELPFPDKIFDAVACNFGVLHLETPEAFLSEAFRVLEPGGRMCFSVWAALPATEGFDMIMSSVAKAGNPHVPLPPGPPFFRFADLGEAYRCMTEAGFTEVKSEEVMGLWELTSSEEMYSIFLQGTGRTRALLEGQTAAETRAIRAELSRQFARHLPEGLGPAVLKMPAVLTSGLKPGTPCEG